MCRRAARSPQLSQTRVPLTNPRWRKLRQRKSSVAESRSPLRSPTVISQRAMAKSAKPFSKFVKPDTLVVVEWDDAWKNDNYDGEHQALRLFQSGFVIQHDSKGIRVVTETNKDGYRRHTHFIPAGMIVKVHEQKWKP
jgi:hypothetical protein